MSTMSPLKNMGICLDLIKNCHRLMCSDLSMNNASLLRREEANASNALEQETINYLQRCKIDSLYYSSHSQYSHIQAVYKKIWENQKQFVIELLNECDRYGVDILLFKGAQVIEQYYQSNPISTMMDIDILTLRHNLVSLKQILYSMGFKPCYFDNKSEKFVDMDIQEIAQIESVHYELAAFSRPIKLDLTAEEIATLKGISCKMPILFYQNEPYLMMSFDVHFQVASNITSEQFFERAIPSAFRLGLAMSPSDHIWFTTTRFYTEVALHGKTTLREFVYLMPAISDSHTDWDLILKIVQHYDFRPALYYFLAFLNQLNAGIPKEVIHELEPTKGERSFDWGWQLSKLFGIVDPFPLFHGEQRHYFANVNA